MADVSQLINISNSLGPCPPFLMPPLYLINSSQCLGEVATNQQIELFKFKHNVYAE